MARHKDADWSLPDKPTDWSQVSVAVLLDIRDELKAVNAKLGCYRIARGLDALHSMGVAARRRKKRRKARQA